AGRRGRGREVSRGDPQALRGRDRRDAKARAQRRSDHPGRARPVEERRRGLLAEDPRLVHLRRSLRRGREAARRLPLERQVSFVGRAARGAARPEDAVSIAAIGALATLPLLEIVLRKTLRIGIPGSILIVQHLTLVVTFAGAALAARSDRLLALETG